jgi:hypothetical protein
VVWPKNYLDGFSLVWVSKSIATVCEWFDLKITRTVTSGLASKPVAMFFTGVASKPMTTISSGLASKPAAMVSPDLVSKSTVGFLVEPQN